MGAAACSGSRPLRGAANADQVDDDKGPVELAPVGGVEGSLRVGAQQPGQLTLAARGDGVPFGCSVKP